jgi:dTDP-4-amino-4,6-dideoxygalactose transaminase
MKSIPFFDLTDLHKSIQKELDRAIRKVIDRGNFILGEEVVAFEKEFARYVGVPYAVGVACGTDALTLSLRAHGIGAGDEVIVPANAYPTAFGVAQSGATIRLIDVNEDGSIDPDILRRVLTRKTRAVVAVHLYGAPANLPAISKILRAYTHHRPILIEDAAQAHGAAIGNKKVGSIGDIGCFSFYPSKNLGALGDGGMVVTKNKTIAKTLRQLRMYGEASRYHSRFVSGTSRLDELQAALLRVKLRHLDWWVQKRRKVAARYIKGLDDVGDITIVTKNLSESAFHLFVIRTKRRDQLITFLSDRGIGTGVHYPTPVHTQYAFRHLRYKKGDFPISEALSRQTLSLPIYPHLTDKEIETVIGSIKSFYRQ